MIARMGVQAGNRFQFRLEVVRLEGATGKLANPVDLWYLP